MSNTYKIIIEAGGDGSGADGAGKAPVPESPSKKPDNKVGDSAVAKNAKKLIAGAGTMLSIANYINTFKMQELNIVTGQTQLAQKRQAISSTAGFGLGLVGSGVAGATIAGPVGAVAGAAIYAGKEALNVAVKDLERYRKQYVENEQIQALRNRAGASFNRSRLN